MTRSRPAEYSAFAHPMIDHVARSSDSFADSRSRETCLGHHRLEQLHRIARRILDDDLFASYARPDRFAHHDPRHTEPLHGGGKIRYLHRKAIPAAGPLWRAIGHGLSAASARVRCA